MGIGILPLMENFAAMIRGVDLSRLDLASDLGWIDDAYSRYGVIFFSSQKLEISELVEFSRSIGPLEEVSKYTPYVHPDHDEVAILSNVVENGKAVGAVDAGQYWHTDVQFLQRPSRGSLLYAIEVPTAGDGTILGETQFADQRKAYAGLPQSLKRAIEGRRAHNSYLHQFTRLAARRDRFGAPPKDIEAVHPVVRIHPDTGEKCLYVSEGYTTSIVGMPEDESKDLLRELLSHATRPEYIYTHHWQAGDVLLWDNCSVQHCAVGNYQPPLRRLMYRTTIAPAEA